MLFLARHLLAHGSGGLAPLHLPGGCLFRFVTGLECPGCGMTRAFLSLADLDPVAAFHYNPWSLPLFLYLLLEAVGLGPRIRPRSRWFWPVLLAAVVSWWLVGRVLPQLGA